MSDENRDGDVKQRGLSDQDREKLRTAFKAGKIVEIFPEGTVLPYARQDREFLVVPYFGPAPGTLTAMKSLIDEWRNKDNGKGTPFLMLTGNPMTYSRDDLQFARKVSGPSGGHDAGMVTVFEDGKLTEAGRKMMNRFVNRGRHR
jgi:hypothetical protein